MLEIKISTSYRYQVVLFLIVISIGISVALYLYFFVDRYSLLYYWDSVSHLVAARKLFDWSENPGLGQIGTVWMPLPHFLLSPFSVIDPLFTSGFAGLVVSLPCIAITSVLLFRITKSQDGPKTLIVPSYVAFIAGMLYATNPNILYLGITAMTEAPFMLFFIASAYYLQKWQQGHLVQDLLKCSIFVSLASSCRYEGWILPLFVIGLCLTHATGMKRSTINGSAMAVDYRPIRKKVLVFLISLLSFSGVLFWLVWNEYHYGNPFQFATEKYYSASWYALNRPLRESLFLQPINDLSVYSVSALTMYGPFLIASAILGFIFRSGYDNSRSSFYAFLALPPLFTIVSLMAGVGELSYWFNSRFLVLLSPLVILLACNLIKRLQAWSIPKSKIFLAGFVGLLFVWQVGTPVFSTVVTLNDAVGGYQIKENQFAIKTGEALKSMYRGNGSIMILTGSGVEQRIMITSGIPLRQFDEIIEGSTWKQSFKQPWLYDSWMVISKFPTSDAQSTTQYWLDRMDTLTQHYRTVYENDIYKILVLKQD